MSGIFVWAIDKNYEEYARVSIASFRKHNPTGYFVVVSEEPISEDVGYDNNIIIELPKLYRNRGVGDRITNAAYLKLFLTELPYNKIIFTDADTLCQHPLDELWNLDVEYIGLCESHKYGKKQAAILGLEKYGLTGMMVMNLDKLRLIGFKDRCLAIQDKPIPDEWYQHDESCINLGMKGLLTFIDKKFNYCYNRQYDNPIREDDAYILHFVGKDKWQMDRSIKYPELSRIKPEIKGKRIAVVGNAQSIFDKQNGEEIDKNDFIIRFNRGFVLKPECQGTRTDFLITAANLTDDEIRLFHPRYTANRSSNYHSNTDFTINNKERCIMASGIGAQPSTGFMAINICLTFGAKEINLYGFDFEKTKSFPNPDGYVTQHNYSKEEEILRGYEAAGLIKIH